MQAIINLANMAQNILDKLRENLDFVASVLLRLYLVPVFWVAGQNKWNPFDKDSSIDSVIQWFGNAEWGLGLPFPALNAYMAWGAEYLGAILLALGLATRWICIPLMFTMIVAISTVHWQHGWQAVVDPHSPYAPATATAAIEELSRAKSILGEYADYDALTQYGNFVISNNGMEWSVTYFLLLMALFFIGGGRFVSLDYWIKRQFSTV